MAPENKTHVVCILNSNHGYNFYIFVHNVICFTDKSVLRMEKMKSRSLSTETGTRELANICEDPWDIWNQAELSRYLGYFLDNLTLIG